MKHQEAMDRLAVTVVTFTTTLLTTLFLLGF